ncbi:MAG: hypothetical protein HC880_03760 [Bacteroidia bacterium]|nr:hypothetical protein [Bacteroidia bacterium]
MKKLSFFGGLSALWLALPLLAFAQTDPIRPELEQIFAPLDKSQVPSRLLYEYGNGYIVEGSLNGSLNDTNYVDIGTWRLAYESLVTAHCSGTNPLLSLETANQRIDQYNPPTNVVQPISIPSFW